MMRETDRFQAAGEDGRVFTVVERRIVSTATTLRGRTAERLGARDYVLSDGRDLNPIDHETFKIVLTDEIIRKV